MDAMHHERRACDRCSLLASVPSEIRLDGTNLGRVEERPHVGGHRLEEALLAGDPLLVSLTLAACGELVGHEQGVERDGPL